MPTLAADFIRNTPIGASAQLPKAGTALENPWVFDSVGRDIKAMASLGVVEVVREEKLPVGSEPLLTDLEFKRLR